MSEHINRLTTGQNLSAPQTPQSTGGPSEGRGDLELLSLIAAGKARGYLTFDEVNSYLPDEAVDPEKIDTLLVALEEQGIELLDSAPDEEREAPSRPETAKASAKPDALKTAVDTGVLVDVDMHPGVRTLTRHRAFLLEWSVLYLEGPLHGKCFLMEAL